MVVDLRITCIQNTVYTGDVSKNIDNFMNIILSLNSDVVVMPEMWFCGFDYNNIKQHAEYTPKVIESLKSNCSGKIIVGSMPEEDHGDIFNTIFVVSSDVIVARYRKQFLFSPQREDQFFKRSDNDITLFEYKSTKFATATCYEIRFPEVFRIGAYNGAEVFLVPAIWPAAKSSHWLTLLRARAIENQAYVVGCSSSSVIKGDKILKCGYSAAFDPWGEQLFVLGEDPDVATINIDLSKVSLVREQIPSLNDAKNCFNIIKKPH